MDRRYTDYDVRSNPELKQLAYEYLIEYVGQFQFLNDCKELLRENGALTVPMVRGVLNSMLADPNVKNMPTPTVSRFDASPFEPRRGDLELNLAGRSIPPRPSQIKLPTRWHYEFGISDHPRSCAVHRVDLARSHGQMVTGEWQVRWYFYWECASHTPPRPYVQTLALFNLDDAMLLVNTGNASHIKHFTHPDKQRNWKICKTCAQVNRR